MSLQRTMQGGWADRRTLPKGPGGRSLCRWCNLEVPEGRFTFCSEWCVREWKLRTDPGYLRDQVLSRDHGICALCGLDTLAEWTRLRRLRGAARERAWRGWSLRPNSRTSLWDADHIVPVCEGGGECDLENLRTLCLRCHRQATAALRQRRKDTSRAAGTSTDA